MKTYIVYFYCILYLFFGCVDKKKKDDLLMISHMNHSEDYYLNKIQSLDTIPFPERDKYFKTLLKDFDNIATKEHVDIYNLVKSMSFANIKSKDSAAFYLNKVEGKGDIQILKYLYSFRYQNNGNQIIPYSKVDSLYKTIHLAEVNKSKFTYCLYDELARVYYLNKDLEKSLEYSVLYFENSPFRDNEKIQQRYYDIRFFIASGLGNVNDMKIYLNKARDLAFRLNDSIAIARIYDYEAQFNSMAKPTETSLDIHKKSYELYKKTNQLNSVIYHNLALSFIKEQQADSALFYINEGRKFVIDNDIPSNLIGHYKLLRDVFLLKKDYESAVRVYDTLLNLTHENQIKIKDDKIAELELKLQTEKKDNDIKVLQETNSLNEQVILQQKWLLIIGGLVLIIIPLFVYNNYNRKLLKEKNEKLEIDKKRYLLEQKARQSQLNPHFIYNAIANMQGLVMADKKNEANNYLVALSKYIRDVLELNRQEYVILDDKIKAIENYLKLQQMRYENVFDYKINVNIQSEDLLIPPMIIQPFIENSIEHGFKNIDYKGLLEIDIQEKENQLYIKILDNGSGKGAGSITKKKSLSRVITQERFDLIFNQDGKRNAYFETRSLIDGNQTGYLVEIFLPLIKS